MLTSMAQLGLQENVDFSGKKNHILNFPLQMSKLTNDQGANSTLV